MPGAGRRKSQSECQRRKSGLPEWTSFSSLLCNLIRLQRPLRGERRVKIVAAEKYPMRVIAGKFRSRQLCSLGSLDIRPTSDRLRETLFNVLTAGNPQALEGSVWLDLFAGTGAVGIEALSRGAVMVYFVECSKDAAELIGKNLKSLEIESGFKILKAEVGKALAQLEGSGVVADFVFLDPTYRMQEEYA